MECATVIHFGRDDCQRVQELRRMGYEVRESISLDRLWLDLECNEITDAVIVSEADPHCAEQAAVLVRQRCGAPLILFRRLGAAIDESPFDRVFSSSVPAAHWLFDTAVLVTQGKELRTASEHLRRRVPHPKRAFCA